MSWSAAAIVVVGKNASDLKDMLRESFAENGPPSGYAPARAETTLTVGEAGDAAALWDPVGKLAFGPKGEDLRKDLSRGTKLVAFRARSADGSYGLRVYEDGEAVRDIEVAGGQTVRETGAALPCEGPSRSLFGAVRDEDWLFDLVEGVTGVPFAALGGARYQTVDV